MGVSTAAASAALSATLIPRSERAIGNAKNPSTAPDDEIIKRRLLRKGVDPTPKILHALRKKETQKSLRHSKKQALKDDPFTLSDSQRQALEEDARFRTAVAEYRTVREELRRRSRGGEREAVALDGMPWDGAEAAKGIDLRRLLGAREETADGKLKGEHLEELRAMLEERNGERFRWLLEDDVEETGEVVYDRLRTPMKKTTRVVGDEEKIRLLIQRLHQTKVSFHDWKFSRLMKQSNLIFTEMSLLKIVHGLGVLGDWRQAQDVVEWVYNEKEYKYRKSRFVYTKLLDVLGKTRRPGEALQIFNKMQEDGQLYPDMAAYHTIAVTLGQAGLVNELISVIERMKQKPSKEVRNKNHRDWNPCLMPDVIIYNAVLNACIPSHQWKGVFWVLEQMRHSNLKPTGATYGLAMEVMLRAGKHEFVHKYFDKMQKSGLTPKALTYKVLVRAFWEEGKVNEAVTAVRNMEQRGIVGAASVYYELACCLCSNGLWQDAVFEIEKLKYLPVTKPLEVAFTGMILSSLDGGHLSDCVAIFEHMKNHCVPNIGTINAMLKVYSQGDMFAKAKELFEATKASFSKCSQNDPLLELDAFSYSYMLELSASAQQWEYFEYVYKEMLLCGYQLDQRKHAGHLVEASRAGKWHLLDHAFDTLLEAEEIPHISIFAALICQAIKQQNFERTTNLLTAMAHASLRVSEIQWTNLIQRDIGGLGIDKLQNLLNHLERRKVIMEEPVPNFLKSLRSICGAILLSDTSSNIDSFAASSNNSAFSDNNTSIENLKKVHDPPLSDNDTWSSIENSIFIGNKNDVGFMDPRSKRTVDDAICNLAVEAEGETLDLMQLSNLETSVTDAALDLLTINNGTPFSGMPSASEILDKWRQERINDSLFSC